MTEAAFDVTAPFERNPFPAVPEVSLGRDTGPIVRIETDAVRKVRSIVAEYLGTGSPPEGDLLPGTGRTLAIIGDLGSGKSHLAADLIRELQRRAVDDRRDIAVLTLAAQPPDTLLTLYRRLFRAPGDDEGGLLDGGDATGGALLQSALYRLVEALHATIRRSLEAGERPPGSFDGDTVVLPFPRGPALDDVELTRRLRKRLERLTGDKECANALSLLMHERDDIADAAWLWLKGADLDERRRRLLADRGVGAPIDSPAQAVSVLCALSRLFNQSGTRLVLVIDEVQALWKGGDQAAANVAATLNPLLGWAGDTGTLLVLCSLADTWHALPKSVHQRTGVVVRPSPLSIADVGSYIEGAQALHNGVRTLAPFSDQIVASVHEKTGGRPRRTIVLCHHAYRHSEGHRVTEQHIREAAHDFSGEETTDEARWRIADLCTRMGHHVLLQYGPAAAADALADIWVPAGPHNGGCAIVVTGSVLDLKAAVPLIRRGRALASGTGDQDGDDEVPPRAAVLVIVGLLADNLVQDMRTVYTRVLDWGGGDPERELSSVLASFLPALTARGEAGLLQRLAAEMHKLRAEVAVGHRHIEQTLTAQFEQRWRRLEAATAEARPELTAGLPDFGAGPGGKALTELFDKPLKVIRAALERPRELWRQLFDSGSWPVIDRLAAPGSRGALPTDLTSEQVSRATAALLALDQALIGFAVSVRNLRAESALSGANPRGELQRLCGHFDTVAKDLLARVPSETADTLRAVPRILKTDQATISRQMRNFGQVVFEAISKEESRPA